MYERSASVLEKHISKTIIYLSELKENYEYYKELINLLENYQHASEKEITYDKEYKLVLSIVEDIQKEQRDISKYNVELENKRNRLFSDNSKSAEEIESYVLEIEKLLKLNSDKLVELRLELIKNLKDLDGKKAKVKQVQEFLKEQNRNFRKSLREITSSYNVITDDQIDWLENVIKNYKKIENDAIEVMMKNGRNEKVPFNEEVIKNGAILGVDIARKECETYIYIYKQTRKFMDEISENKVRLEMRKKIFFIADSKIKFLEAEKEYLNRFLDNERSTAINSIEAHDNLMKDALEKFALDIRKINKLYALFVREIRGKVPKEEFQSLYDSSHYRDIEEKELKFQRDTRKLGIGGVVSPYYWRREGIRGIYDVFAKIITPLEQDRIDNNEIIIDDVERVEELVEEEEINSNENEKQDELQINNDTEGNYEEYKEDSMHLEFEKDKSNSKTGDGYKDSLSKIFEKSNLADENNYEEEIYGEDFDLQEDIETFNDRFINLTKNNSTEIDKNFNEINNSENGKISNILEKNEYISTQKTVNESEDDYENNASQENIDKIENDEDYDVQEDIDDTEEDEDYDVQEDTDDAEDDEDYNVQEDTDDTEDDEDYNAQEDTDDTEDDEDYDVQEDTDDTEDDEDYDIQEDTDDTEDDEDYNTQDNYEEYENYDIKKDTNNIYAGNNNRKKYDSNGFFGKTDKQKKNNMEYIIGNYNKERLRKLLEQNTLEDKKENKVVSFNDEYNNDDDDYINTEEYDDNSSNDEENYNMAIDSEEQGIYNDYKYYNECILQNYNEQIQHDDYNSKKGNNVEDKKKRHIPQRAEDRKIYNFDNRENIFSKIKNMFDKKDDFANLRYKDYDYAKKICKEYDYRFSDDKKDRKNKNKRLERLRSSNKDIQKLPSERNINEINRLGKMGMNREENDKIIVKLEQNQKYK